MDKFDFVTVGHIIFGPGQVERIGQLAVPFGSTALVLHNVGQPGDGGALDTVIARLTAAGVRAIALRQQGEPQVPHVDQGIKLARESGCRLIIGLGGGSALDAAKAVAALLTNPGTALDYMEVIGKGLKITHPAAPWIAIPTTGGTGAEVTRNAVIGFAPRQFKASIRSEHLLARLVLVDPQLMVKVRPDITARAGLDALCQLIESYTSTGANPMTDALALRGIERAARSLVRACEHGDDLAAREDMALAALWSGITLSNAGLGAVHGFAAPLGANFPIPHGIICAALLPHVIQANVVALRALSSAHPTLARYAEIGRILANDHRLDSTAAIHAVVRSTSNLAHTLHIPPLKHFGISDQDVVDMVGLARRSSSMRFNPVQLSDAALADILLAGIDGNVVC